MKKSELIGLVEQMQDGSRDAFEKLYEEYYDRLYFFVLKNVGNKEAAEDITQDTFIKSLEKIHTLKQPENFVTWLHTIAYRRCTDLFRSRRRDVYFDTDEELEDALESHSLNEPVMVPEDYATNKDISRQLKTMIDSLKPDMKSALILYYYNDMSLTDISKTMGISETNVKQKLFRARRKLREKIEKIGGKGVMLAAVPMDEMLHRTVSPKYAASVAAKSGTAAVGMGLTAGKAAGIAAAAAIAVGIPLVLGNIGKDKHDLKGDMQIYDSSAASSYSAVESSSSTMESSAEKLIASSLADSSVLEKNTSSRPDKTSSLRDNTAASSTAGIKVTAAVNASSKAEGTSSTASVDTNSAPETKQETQPVEMSVDKMLSMTPSQLRELSNNDFELIESESWQVNPIKGIRCAAFPNYVFEISPRFAKGEPEGKLETYNGYPNAGAAGDTRIIYDSEEISQLALYDGAEVGGGVKVGMTYNEIKEALGVDPKVCQMTTTISPAAIVKIDGRIWLLHFDLTDEQRTAVMEQINAILEERTANMTEEEKERLSYADVINYPGNPYNIKIDLSNLDPVCDVAVCELSDGYTDSGKVVKGNYFEPYVNK